MNLRSLRVSAALFLAACTAFCSHAEGLADRVAVQTWTLRNLKFDEVVAFAKAHGIKDLQLIPNHLDYKKESKEELARKKGILDLVPAIILKT